ncbi:MAG: hypothetical protein U1C46_08675 [Bacteroidales bacterium]|nr:hypothetical protein [Bacteroidales bacterium]
MTIDKLFDLLDDWRNLPAYQLERRADIFFALHLETILRKALSTEVDLIIPEFPVRVGEISETLPELNKSFKIDYLAYSKNSQKVFLIELKTDQRSLREKQDWYLENAAKIKVSGLIDGLVKIYAATQQKTKYDRLLEKLEKIHWIEREEKSIKNLKCEIEPEVIYIQPLNPEGRKNVISFDNIISALSDSEEPLTIRFVESLEKWKTDTNNK